MLSFPGQETTAEASKIPTVIYYDSRGKVKAVGAEATREGKHEIALEEQWIKADSEWYVFMRMVYSQANFS